MKTFLIFVLTLSWLTNLIAQNQPPQVSNVSFLQRDDGTFIVDIYYDVNDPDGNPMNISMKASSDDGATWDNFTCNNITGDLAAGITNGTGKHIIWDFAAEHPQTFGKKFKIKIIADDQACTDLSNVTYEGQTYNTVQVGNQCWLRENLNAGTIIPGSQNHTDNGIKEKYCYNDDPENCTAYGGLYQWNEAMQYIINEGAQGLCPAGWHIPTLAEFETLKSLVNNDGNVLKREDQGSGAGQGTNTSGFSALLAGYRYVGGNFYNLGDNAYFWSSTELDANNAYVLTLFYANSNIFMYGYREEHGRSVRCLKD